MHTTCGRRLTVPLPPLPFAVLGTLGPGFNSPKHKCLISRAEFAYTRRVICGTGGALVGSMRSVSFPFSIHHEPFGINL